MVEFIPGLSVVRNVAFCVVLWGSLLLSFLYAIELYVLDLLYHGRFVLWHFQTLDIALSVLRFTTFVSFWYLLITPSIFFIFSFCTLWSPLWCLLITSLVFSDYALDIFRSLRLYLLITPLVSSDYDFGIFWLPPLVSSDKLIVFFWLTHCYFQCFVRNSLRLPIISDLLAKL